MLMLQTAATEWQKAWPGGVFTLGAALVASGLTYFGVLKGFKAHAQRERDSRETELRRQVFLEASEAISIAMDCLSTVPDFDVTDAELHLMLKDFQIKTGKLELVADLKTISAFFVFRREFHKASKVLSPLRGEMMGLKRKLDAAKNQLQQFREALNPRTSGMTKEQLDAAAQTEKQFMDTMLGIANQIRSKSLEIHTKLQEFSDSLAETQLEFFYCARQEFGFDTKKEEYLRLTREDTKVHTELVLSALSEMTRKSTEPGQSNQDIASG